MAVKCTTDKWPLLVLELSGQADREHSIRLLETLSAQVQRGRCAVVIDSRRVQLADAITATENVQREARWIRDNQRLIARNVAAFTLVVDNVAVRFLFSSLLSLASINTLWQATTRFDEGVAFCERALQGSGRLVASTKPASLPPPR